MDILKKLTRIFRKKTPVTEPDILFPGLVSARQFAAFKPDSRLQAVMITGDSADPVFFDFMKWCIQYDPDLGVRLAALKRLPNFIGQNDLFPFLIYLDKSNEKSRLEPYLSMALSRTGLITADEFKVRINGS
jgi:hypothetical protein